jgi:KaiC/GvpD/RAD55 family RecA-like ATPase
VTEFSEQEIRKYYRVRVPGVRIINAREWRGKCPVHQGEGDNFAVESATGMAHCHSQCQRGWDILGLEMELTGSDFVKAKKSVFELIGRPVPDYNDRDVIAAYDYTDDNGNLLYQVVRKHPKRFAQRKPDGQGGWVWSLGDMPRVPFLLPKLARAKGVVICEGEKDVLALQRRGMTATCNSEGAGKWRPELCPYLQGKDVLIVPDNDKPGRDHALSVAQSLYGIASRVRVLEVPQLPAKGDLSDFFASGRTIEEFKELAKKSQVFEPGFRFASEIPSEEERWVFSIPRIITEAGGRDRLWNLIEDGGIPTPYTELTEDLAGGLRKSEVYILGGARGSGKTSMVLQFISKAVQAKHGCLLFSLEMSQKSVLQRIVAIRERVDLAQVRVLQKKRQERTIDAKDNMQLDVLLRKLIRGTSQIEDLPILVHQKPSITPSYLIQETKRISEKQKIDLVVIDHMQLMASDSNERKEYEKFTAISRALKGEVARELNVPVLVVSQVSRSNAVDKRSELEITDLRGSGALEEDAAAVLLLFHDPEDTKRAKLDGRIGKGPLKAWLKVGKNRFGQSGTMLEIYHHKRFTRFDTLNDADYEPDQPVGELEVISA